jgi:hypothetical protein
MNLAQAVQYVLSGITVGSVYAITAIGFNIIYATTGIINFAQGEFLIVGAMTAISLSQVVPLPVAIALAAEASTDSVIGIGQNRPFAIFMPSHTPSQSARVMNPSRGVNPPMPSMMMSPFSRELTRTGYSSAARFLSAASAGPSSSSGRRSPPPWGLTSAMMFGLHVGMHVQATAW